MIDIENEGTVDHPDITSPQEPDYETSLSHLMEDEERYDFDMPELWDSDDVEKEGL